MKHILHAISETPGYFSEISINDNEFKFLKESISSQWLSRIYSTSQEVWEKVIEQNIQIEDYHIFSDAINHQKLWPKQFRILEKSFFEKFLETNFFATLKKIFGEIQISDEEKLGFGNIYWRLVRPNQKNDIGPFHRDSWFWELNKDFPRPKYPFKRIKVWIAISTEIGKSGLLVEEDSHKRKDINYEGKFKDGVMKPLLLDKADSLDMKLLTTKPGDVIIFNDDLIHGGALNKGEKTRVSVEFTLLKKIN